MKDLIFIGTLTFLMSCWLAACGDPCRDLSEKICRCERTDVERRNCLARVSNLASQRQSSSNKTEEQEGRNRCVDLFQGCTCAVLAQGGLQACGLSTE